MRGAASAAALALFSAGCGSTASPSGDREWVANAHGAIVQLRADVLAAAAVDPSSALHDDASLYPALLVFTDFGGCSHMVGALGTPPAVHARVEPELDRACVELRRAAALFTVAVRDSSVAGLREAIETAQRALGPLDRAELQLRRE